MDSKFILTDGMKAVDLLHSSDPDVWAYFSGAPKTETEELYARVAAVFRAFNLKANTVSSMPFTLNDLSSGEEYDNSATWENKVGFMPNPSELLRLNTLSYITSNTVYNLRTTDVLGRKAKGMYFAIPSSFKPQVNAQSTNVDYIERTVGTTTERYDYPDDKRLVRMWRMDHTTELLPSPNTEALAVMKSAQILSYADTWIAHFYRSGGIPPTAIAMKGAVNPTKKDDEEKSWNEWIMGIGKRWFNRRTRVYNADTLEVKQFGSSVTELKDNPTYRQALENIAMGTGMPLSLLLANSSNYATAKEEKATWFDSDIIPLCNWMAYEYNRQVFIPLGYYLEFHPETLDPQQEDETARAQAFSTYMDVITKCPTYDIFVGMAQTLGLELSDGLVSAAEKYYAEKKRAAEAVAVQTEPKPMEAPQPEQEAEEPEEEEQPPAKWIPTLDHLQELKTWRKAALQRLKRGESLTFEYIPHYGGLPENVTADIKARLAEECAWTDDTIKAIFDIARMVADEPKTKAKSEIVLLAESINALAQKGTA